MSTSSTSLAITIPNVGAFPLSTLESLAGLVPVVTKGIQAGKGADAIVADLEAAAPAALIGLAESVLNVLVPGSGTILQAVAWLVENNKNSAMSQDEQNAWADRFGIGTQS